MKVLKQATLIASHLFKKKAWFFYGPLYRCALTVVSASCTYALFEKARYVINEPLVSLVSSSLMSHTRTCQNLEITVEPR